MHLRRPVPLALFALCLFSTLALAQTTTINLGTSNCGRGQAFNCQLTVVDSRGAPTGGRVWLDYIPNYSHFIQFSVAADASGDPLAATAYNVAATITAVVRVTTASAPNAYRIDVKSFSFIDADGENTTGTGTIYYHYYYSCCGSGRGGGAGWYMRIDHGVVTLK
jgi:hypothetical protein